MTEIPKFRPKKPRLISHHPQPGYNIRGRVWIEKDGELFLGQGRIMLLERIDQFGSISAAARSMRLGYRNAWLWIEATNRLAQAPLVEKTTGGIKGGGARLTDEGRKAIDSYKKLRQMMNEVLEHQ